MAEEICPIKSVTKKLQTSDTVPCLIANIRGDMCRRLVRVRDRVMTILSSSGDQLRVDLEVDLATAHAIVADKRAATAERTSPANPIT